jgi:hypothetical protein
MNMSVADAVQFAHQHAYDTPWTEVPPGSNHTKCWTDYDKIYHEHYNGQPWCGASNCVVCHAGGWTAPAQFISVYALYQWGLQTKRFHRVTSAADLNRCKQGDLTIVGGPTEHEEFAMADAHDGQVLSHGGNTSPGREGNQFNGGAEAIKVRDWTEIYGFVVTHDLLNHPDKDPKDVPILHEPVTPQYKAEDPFGALHIWVTGTRVDIMQQHLGMESDGYYGRETAKAVEAWKKKHHWDNLDGNYAGLPFLDALSHTKAARHTDWTTLKEGDLGGKVRKLQRWLNTAIGAGLREDGNFGPATRRAVVKAKRKAHLKPDGVAGTHLWEWLAEHH